MTPYLTPLNSDDLRSAGIPAPWTFGIQDTVRYGEIDMLQHVNNTVYLKWFENLRVRYFVERGIWTGDGNAPMVVLRNIGIHFRSEVKLLDDYILTARTTKMGNTSFTMEYGVWVGGDLKTTSDAILVMVNADKTKCTLPAHVRDIFTTMDGTPPQ